MLALASALVLKSQYFVCSCFNDLNKLSTTALSQQFPLRLMLQDAPNSLGSFWWLLLAHWLPLSRYCIRWSWMHCNFISDLLRSTSPFFLESRVPFWVFGLLLSTFEFRHLEVSSCHARERHLDYLHWKLWPSSQLCCGQHRAFEPNYTDPKWCFCIRVLR